MQYTIKEYVDRQGRSLFGNLFNELDPPVASKVVMAQYRLQLGNFSNVKSVGRGVFEYKIDFGPGYRVYFGQDGKALIILLAGGTKKCQQKDISDSAGKLG